MARKLWRKKLLKSFWGIFLLLFAWRKVLQFYTIRDKPGYLLIELAWFHEIWRYLLCGDRHCGEWACIDGYVLISSALYFCSSSFCFVVVRLWICHKHCYWCCYITGLYDDKLDWLMKEFYYHQIRYWTSKSDDNIIITVYWMNMTDVRSIIDFWCKITQFTLVFSIVDERLGPGHKVLDLM